MHRCALGLLASYTLTSGAYALQEQTPCPTPPGNVFPASGLPLAAAEYGWSQMLAGGWAPDTKPGMRLFAQAYTQDEMLRAYLACIAVQRDQLSPARALVRHDLLMQVGRGRSETVLCWAREMLMRADERAALNLSKPHAPEPELIGPRLLEALLEKPPERSTGNWTPGSTWSGTLDLGIARPIVLRLTSVEGEQIRGDLSAPGSGALVRLRGERQGGVLRCSVPRLQARTLFECNDELQLIGLLNAGTWEGVVYLRNSPHPIGEFDLRREAR